jgi:CheY-like chemotaxis protein
LRPALQTTVYGIVRQNKGWIGLYSEPGKGTTFKIFLPQLAEAGKPAARASGEEMLTLGGTETILIVEDQSEVRELTAKVLRQYGYRILESANGSEALRLCEARRDEIHMMITDVIMPGMSGRDLADKIAALHPDIRVLYISGYTAELICHDDITGSAFAYLQKPFTPLALACKVRAILNRSRE